MRQEKNCEVLAGFGIGATARLDHLGASFVLTRRLLLRGVYTSSRLILDMTLSLFATPRASISRVSLSHTKRPSLKS